MHKNQEHAMSVNYYARILIVISITFLVSGIVLDFSNTKRLIDPVKEVTPLKGEKSTISITTSDGSEIVPGNTIVKENEDSQSIIPSENNETIESPIVKNNNTEENSNTEKSNQTQEKTNTHIPQTTSIEDKNNNLRNEIQSKYDITIKYGSETDGYNVAGVETTPIKDENIIQNQLYHLNNILSLYPLGLFQEIKNGGIPLTIILINSYSENSITGVTDSSNSYATISIAAVHPFEESFYHESYHYIERYLFKKGANYNSWDTMNPADFQYGTIYNTLSYNNTFLENAPFVNNYAQTSSAEDRASTFEYMMASNKASCLNNGNTVWKKAIYMSRTIDAVLNTVKPGITEYWERFL